MGLADDVREASRQDRALERLKELLATDGFDLRDLGRVEKIRRSEYQSLTKNAEGEAEIHDLAAASIVLAPSWESGPEWPVVAQAKPVTVKAPKAPRSPALGGKWKTAVFLPDPQIGYRRLADGTLDPFHDERAINVALQIVEAERPDVVVWLGDVLDFAPVGKYRFEPGFALTMQPAIDRGHEILAVTSELCDDVRFISGNHDERLRNHVTDNALQAFGLKRAGAVPEDWPVLSVAYLLRLDELGIEYVGAYPAGATYMNDRLAAIHGKAIGNKTRSAAQIVAENEVVSVVYGHTHKKAMAYKARNTRGEAVLSWAYSPGCLCLTDGSVPGTMTGTDEATGLPIRSFQDWHQGVGVVRYDEDAKHLPRVEDVTIDEGFALHGGQEFVADA